MTSSSTTTATGCQTKSRSEIPGDDVIAADEKDATESTNPKAAEQSPSDVRPAAATTAKRPSVGVLAKGAELRSAFTRSPEQISQDAPLFNGNENYGFEWVKWVQGQQRNATQNCDEHT